VPILQRLVKARRGCIQALVVAPTRELSDQINAAFESLGRQMHLRSLPLYGGVPIAPQVRKLRSGVEIVVACPGRLLDHIRQGTIRLSSLEFIVLDEADRMLDMGFLPDIREILKHVPTVRQRLMFGATMPDEIRRLAEDVLRAPAMLQVDSPAPAATVAQAVYPVPPTSRPRSSFNCCAIPKRLPFLSSRDQAPSPAIGLQIGRAGYQTTSLQGNLSQNQRQAAIRGFRDGSYRVLVATDIAARGIDVSRISHVINYDMPDTTDAYTHRIGRTGRAEKTGDAFSLVTHEDEDMVRSIENLLGTRLERRRLSGFDYQKPAIGEKGKVGQRGGKRPMADPGRKRLHERTFKAAS